jgi:hypothetical protein
MSGLQVDRLSLSLEGFSPGEARRLAALVAEGLADLDLPDGVAHLGQLSVELPAAPGAGVDQLAARVLARLARQFAAEGAAR